MTVTVVIIIVVITALLRLTANLTTREIYCMDIDVSGVGPESR
jgi:hypothetical protein